MAGTRFVIDASEIRQLAANLARAPQVTADECRVAMERSAILVQSEARRNIQRQKAIDTGQLLNSIVYRRPVQPFEAKIGTNKTYAPTVEFGRQPGAPMPPSGALRGWMSRHGIPAAREFIIRRAIARRGIRPRPFLHPALENNRTQINREFAAANRRIAARVTA